MKRSLFYQFMIGGILVFLTIGCDDYLDKEPNKSSNVVPTDVEQLDELFNNYKDFSCEYNYVVFLSVDSYGVLPELEKAKPNTYPPVYKENSLWNIEDLMLETKDLFFTGEYKKIFIANTVLNYLNKVSGDKEKKHQLELEAKFIRAYSLWELAEVYCLPYTEGNKNELGLTLKNSVSFEETQARSTLSATYDAIQSDLKDALELTNDMKLVNGFYQSWRANKAAVNGLAARLSLEKGDYEQALNYSTTALKSHSALVDYNTEMHYSTIPSFEMVNGKKVDIYYPYTHDVQWWDLKFTWKELMYFRFVDNILWWYIPSKALLDVYDHDYDLRYKYHIVQGCSYERGFNDVGIDYPGYIFFFKDMIPSGPTTAEMLLIQAECLARLGKIDEAMLTVNKLRAVRMDVSAPKEVINLSATTKEEAVKKIIDERWREMPFTLRWYDMRRLNHNEEKWDDIGPVTREFYSYNSSTTFFDGKLRTYTLEPGSRRYATPIIQKEIDTSHGKIEQNKY